MGTVSGAEERLMLFQASRPRPLKPPWVSAASFTQKTTFLLPLSHPSLHRTRTGTGLPSGEECVLGLASALDVSEIVLKVSEETVLQRLARRLSFIG